ncbi:conserved Plasmodium protein, unknown function [Babesia microti strain RI]|uniref:Uncharacterized protein n=1 Tax=Babesia microti (strain RI) TaxID=1133968 RepID=A0A1N6LXX0_BABMR|nr:conserved Plasmodium protein, unknown function [Babesia microti strain RI]SIO73711.1 conserved Plasmodium protein, unknown function [Babesia microti strain RI]|eukprot:XP_021337778.1 conserved Plasmodium protein, unknown function [Babesia microti strain RI]
MELLLNASQVLLFRKIISLFRQITQSLHIISTEEGLELSALNSSNTAWLHVFFAQSFFVSYRTINKLSKKELKTLISAKNFYNSLTSPDSYLTKRNNHLNSLDTCIISSESESDALSFSLHFCNGLICRTTSVSLEDSPSQFPDIIDWAEYNYFRFHPKIILRCINPYCFNEDDIVWSADSKTHCIEIKILTARGSINRQSPLLGKDDFSCSNIKLDSSQFDELSLVNNTDCVYSVFSIKQLAAVANLSDSINIPLALVFKDPGDPAFVLFGKAAYLPSKNFNPQAHILNSPTLNIKSTNSRQNDHWSGALWMSTIVSEHFKQTSSDNVSGLVSQISIPQQISITSPQSQLFNYRNLLPAASVLEGDTVPHKPQLFSSQSPSSPIQLEIDTSIEVDLHSVDREKEEVLVLFNEFQGDIINKSPISLDQFNGEYIDTDGSISDFESNTRVSDEFSKLGCLLD